MAEPSIWRWDLGKYMLPSAMLEARDMAQWTADAARARVARGDDESRPDVYGAFTNAKHPKTGRSFDRKDLFTESIVLLGAGMLKLQVSRVMRALLTLVFRQDPNPQLSA